MALNFFQRGVCQLLANNRKQEGQSYVAGGAALNEVMHSPRTSRDIDIFHDTLEAVEQTWHTDFALLKSAGYQVRVVRELTGFVEAEIGRGDNSVLLQWARDSAFRFFPLMEHADFGLTLHPIDLATNKILALVGRRETRDWIDTLSCHRSVSPLGLIAWAACGKDEGWNPQLILDEANRNAKLSKQEWQQMEWDAAPPDLIELKKEWREALANAQNMIDILPPEETGKVVLAPSRKPFVGSLPDLQSALKKNQLIYHSGYIGGAWPEVKAG